MKFATLPIAAQQNFIRILSNETGLDPQIIEKDWWVTTVLRALDDEELFRSIVDHRKNFIGLKEFDYSTLTPATLNIVPPLDVIAEWKKDYERMQESMIYGESLPFDKLIEQIKGLNRQINQI